MRWWRWLRHLHYAHYQADLGPVVEVVDGFAKKRPCKYCGRKFLDFTP